MSNCPYCGGELEKGIFRSRGGNFFQPDNRKVPAILTKSNLEKAGCIPLPPSPYGHSFSHVHWPAAYVCRSCKKIIIPYDESER